MLEFFGLLMVFLEESVPLDDRVHAFRAFLDRWMNTFARGPSVIDVTNLFEEFLFEHVQE